jgi:diguanylate cyclase (GGDEF)-like protein
MKSRILIADDEPHIREVLRFSLEVEDYEVVEACDGAQAFQLAEQILPDAILLDVMMPRMDGFETLMRLRASYATRHIPIIMLTAKGEKSDVLEGLRGGANDYVSKPFDREVVLQRVRNQLEWSRQQRAASPLTGLPGNLSINAEIERRIASGKPFAFLQLDIDYFKAFNDQYGYARGDEAIKTVSRILVTAAARHDPEGFVGHIGGDDFVLLTCSEAAETIGQEIIEEFDRLAPSLYDEEDRGHGYVEVPNRRHQPERFPLMSITIALVNTEHIQVTHLAQLADIAQELKEHGKRMSGSVLVNERRQHGSPGSEHRNAA